MTSPGVLVLGEEKIVIKDLTVCLGNIGYQLVGCPNTVEEAIRMVPELRPELVLVNATPKVDFDAFGAGDSIAGSFRIPVVFLTTHRNEPLKDHIKTGSFGYLEKPFSRKRLRTVLENVMAPHNRYDNEFHRTNPDIHGNGHCHSAQTGEE